MFYQPTHSPPSKLHRQKHPEPLLKRILHPPPASGYRIGSPLARKSHATRLSFAPTSAVRPPSASRLSIAPATPAPPVDETDETELPSAVKKTPCPSKPPLSQSTPAQQLALAPTRRSRRSSTTTGNSALQLRLESFPIGCVRHLASSTCRAVATSLVPGRLTHATLTAPKDACGARPPCTSRGVPVTAGARCSRREMWGLRGAPWCAMSRASCKSAPPKARWNDWCDRRTTRTHPRCGPVVIWSHHQMI